MHNNEIIKALEHCRDGNCAGCPWAAADNCLTAMATNTLDFINSQNLETQVLKLQNENMSITFNSLDEIDQFAEWLDEHGQFDGAPWIKWFNERYCNNCEPIICHYKNSEWKFPCSWCELEHKCKFFPDMDDTPNNRNIIDMWLKANITTQN